MLEQQAALPIEESALPLQVERHQDVASQRGSRFLRIAFCFAAFTLIAVLACALAPNAPGGTAHLGPSSAFHPSLSALGPAGSLPGSVRARSSGSSSAVLTKVKQQHPISEMRLSSGLADYKTERVTGGTQLWIKGMSGGSLDTSTGQVSYGTKQWSKVPTSRGMTVSEAVDVDTSAVIHENERQKPVGVGAGELHVLQNVPFALGMPERRVWVWLPPGYAAAAAAGSRFPVIYCHDGQNMMDSSTSWLNADWNLGRVASELQAEGRMRPTIMVLIANCCEEGGSGQAAGADANRGTLRRVEYGDNILGKLYVNWMSDTLKPVIDRRYSTQTAPQDTFSLGSSMGGLISFLATLWRPDVFGNAIVVSPAFQPQTIANLFIRSETYKQDPYQHQRFYISNGGSTPEKQVPMFDARDGNDGGYWWLDTQLQPGVDAMLVALQKQGLELDSSRLRYQRFPGDRHNERAWQRQVADPLEFMLSPEKHEGLIAE